MAKRPVFVPTANPDQLVDEKLLDFKWNPGFAIVQKKKNILALHISGKNKGLSPLLEVSTKSEVELGRRLSPFSLKIDTPIGNVNLEAIYQGSKVFEEGGPYTDIYQLSSREAKKDSRLKNSGKLIGFNYFGQQWSLEPKTAFYDWIYLKALQQYQDYIKENLFMYQGFTDIEFNPKKAVSCQARSCALLVSLLRLNLLNQALNSKEDFIKIVFSRSIYSYLDPSNNKEKELDKYKQLELLNM